MSKCTYYGLNGSEVIAKKNLHFTLLKFWWESFISFENTDEYSIQKLIVCQKIEQQTGKLHSSNKEIQKLIKARIERIPKDIIRTYQYLFNSWQFQKSMIIFSSSFSGHWPCWCALSAFGVIILSNYKYSTYMALETWF